MIGEICRSILAEAHAVMEPLQDGPFYVVHDRGTFTLYPFGRWADHRYCYRMSLWEPSMNVSMPAEAIRDYPDAYWIFTVYRRGGR